MQGWGLWQEALKGNFHGLLRVLRVGVLGSVILKSASVHREALMAAGSRRSEPRTAAGPFIWGLTWRALPQRLLSSVSLLPRAESVWRPLRKLPDDYLLAQPWLHF